MQPQQNLGGGMRRNITSLQKLISSVLKVERMNLIKRRNVETAFRPPLIFQLIIRRGIVRRRERNWRVGRKVLGQQVRRNNSRVA